MTLWFFVGVSDAASPAESIGRKNCGAIAARVDAMAGAAPVFLRSYDHERGEGE